VRVTSETQTFLTRGRVPDLHGVVGTTADDRLAVRGEGQAADVLWISLEGVEDLPGVRIPDLKCSANASGSDLLAVAATGHVADIQSVKFGGITFEDEQLLTRVPVPHSHHPFGAGAHDSLAVVVNGHAVDQGRVPCETEGFLTGLRVPDPHPEILMPA